MKPVTLQPKILINFSNFMEPGERDPEGTGPGPTKQDKQMFVAVRVGKGGKVWWRVLEA